MRYIIVIVALTLLFLYVCWRNYSRCVNKGDASMTGVMLSAFLYYGICWLVWKYLGKDYYLIVALTLAAPFGLGFVTGGSSKNK